MKQEQFVEKHKPFVGIPPTTRVIAVASGKGGVGKSTLALHLALALRRDGFKVGILDADIHGPSLPHLLNCDQKHVVSGGIIAPIEVAGLKAVSRGFLNQGAEASLWRGPITQRFLLALLGGVAWGNLDILILDLPPGTGDIPITLGQKISLFGAIIVSTSQELALLDVRKTMSMFETLSVPILGLIENMSYRTCTSCHFKTPFFQRGLVKKEALARGYDFLGDVPWLQELAGSFDEEGPEGSNEPSLECCAVFSEIILHIHNKIS